MTKKKKPRRKTIKRAELARLCFCNSPRLPLFVNDNGTRYHWIGIGWSNHGPAKGTEVKVVD